MIMNRIMDMFQMIIIAIIIINYNTETVVNAWKGS